MNNFPTITLVHWETRNWRHHEKALVWCKNYGLKQVGCTFFAGKLYSKEQRDLRSKFTLLFNKKTENFSFIPLCQSCVENALISDSIKSDMTRVKQFELIQVAEKVQ